MKNPKISIIVPTYNQGNLIKEALDSIFAQNYPNFEVIVIDGQSTDCTHEIVSEYSNRDNFIWISEHDKGQSNAINKGMRLANGEIVSWLNSDDILYDGALCQVGKAFFSNPEISLIYGCGAKIDYFGKIIKEIPYQPFHNGFFKNALTVLQPSVFFKYEIFNKVNGIDEDLQYAMDWDLFLKISRVGKCLGIESNIAKLRIYDATKTSSGSWERSREIATIGLRHNGIKDRNYLSFFIRNIVNRLTSSHFAHHLIDQGMVRVWGRNGFMIRNWPE